MSERRSILGSAKLIALCTLLSRITGLLREILFAWAFGQTYVADAFKFGFLIPNLFRRLFGEGALTAVFVPTFTRTLDADGRPAAWQLLSRTATLLTLVLLSLVVLIELFLLVFWLMSDHGSAGHSLVITLTALMLPFMLSICLLALFSSMLNCLGSFVPGALASIVLNLVMIAGIMWIGPWIGGSDHEWQAVGVALTVLLAGVLQLLFIWPALRREGVLVRWNLEPRDPAVRKMMIMMAPVLLGQGALMLSTYLDGQVCLALTRSHRGAAGATLFGTGIPYPLSEGALTAVTNAQTLYQFPLGVLVISLATAALPAFSRLAARGDWQPWTEQVRSLLRLAVFEGLLAGAMMLVAAEPIVRVLFEYGRFDAAATTRAANVLAIYGLAMAAFCAAHIVNRAFYSLDDVKTPLYISLTVLPINFALSLTLVWFDGIREAAFAISSAITATLSVIVSITLLGRRVPERMLDRNTLSAFARMLIAATIAAVAVAFGHREWFPTLAALPAFLARLIDAAICLGGGAVIYLAASALLGLPEPTQLLHIRQRNQPSNSTATTTQRNE
jgi:putative peptidoglycan lipid II flippase